MSAVVVALALVVLGACGTADRVTTTGPAGSGPASTEPSTAGPSTTVVVTTTEAPDLSPVAPAGDNPAYEGSPGGPTVAILGDSLLTDVGAGTPLDRLLRTDFRTSRVATFGARADEMVAAALGWQDTAEIAVVGLGANDSIAILWGRWTLALTYQAFSDLHDAFGAAGCIVYVTIDEQAPCFDCGVATDINAWWRVQALLDPARMRIADWSAVENDFGGWEVWSWDGLHQTVDGNQLMAEVIDAAVRSCPVP